LVLREIPEAEQNIVWNLFSGDSARIATAFQRLQPQLPSWSSILNNLLEYYGLEGMPMPYTMADFEREVEQKVLNKASPEKLLAHLTIEQRLAGLSPDELENYLKKLKAAQGKEIPKQPETLG
jgi:hypothetical protein